MRHKYASVVLQLSRSPLLSSLNTFEQTGEKASIVSNKDENTNITPFDLPQNMMSG